MYNSQNKRMLTCNCNMNNNLPHDHSHCTQKQLTLKNSKEMSVATDRGPNSLKLKDVFSELYDATDKWFNLGLQLDVDSNDLDRIESTLQNNTDRLRKMLTVRLNQGDLTWDHIIEALENHTVCKKVTADEIRSKYIKPQSATTIPPVERANSMPTMAPTATVTPVTSTSNTATETRVTAATSSQFEPLSSFKEPSTSTILVNAISSEILNVPKIAPMQEGSHSSTPMARKRPASNTSPESSKRPKTSEAEYYHEDMFVNKKKLTKYQCAHCKKLPKSFFRCKCCKVGEKQEIRKGKPRFEDNTGLSCSNCKIHPCSNCERNDQYEPDKFTSDNIRKLKVSCENNCGETITLNNLENRSHVRNKCSKRKRLCKYAWAGCTHEGAGEEIEQHEKKKTDVHVLAAIDELHEENLKLKKDNSDLKKDNLDLKKCNLDLNKRIKMIEAKLNPGGSGSSGP